MTKRPETPKGSDIKIEHLYTQESECASQDTIEFTGNFQFHPLTPQAKSSRQNIEIPFSEKLKRQLNDNRSSLFSSSRDLGKADNVSQTDKMGPKQRTLTSIVDIKATESGNQEEEAPNLFLSFNKLIQKSMNNLNTKESQPSLHKSGTLPAINQAQQYGDFEIKTNFVHDSRDFKKEKKQRGEEKNKTMSYLTIASHPVQKDRNNKMAASRVINDTRITLRDYMFMANASSRKAAEVKRAEIYEQHKGTKNDSKRVLKTEPALQNTPKPSIQPRRERYQKEKYHISNSEMGDVLKSSIREEISQLTCKTQSIQGWMQVHSKVSNEELILLYNMRSDLINYNKKFQESISKLTSTDHKLFINAIHQVSVENLDTVFKGDSDSEIFQLAQI